MSEEFKDFTATPTLTLDPFQDKAAPVLQQETALKPEEAGWDDSMLTVEEKQMVDDFAKQIDLKNSNDITVRRRRPEERPIFPKKPWIMLKHRIWARSGSFSEALFQN